MTNREIGFQLGKLAREERRITNEVLKMIALGLRQRAYVEHGFDSMLNWLVKEFGYSHAAAYRRIEAARMMSVVPEVEIKLENGEVNLTTLSKAQTAIRAQEKVSAVSHELKTEIIEKIENKSAIEAEQILCAILPEAASAVRQERQTVIDENTTRRSMNFSKEMNANLQRAKELLSHKFPNASDADVIAYALEFLLAKKDPLQSDAAAASKRVSKAGAKRVMLKGAQGGCTYKDPVTGRVCGSRYQVQFDHIIPKALGGIDDPSNLRLLCRQHNLLAAEQVFGKAHMDRFRT